MGNETIVSHAVTELADGLHWLNPLTSQYEETVEALEITAQGYTVARRWTWNCQLWTRRSDSGCVSALAS